MAAEARHPRIQACVKKKKLLREKLFVETYHNQTSESSEAQAQQNLMDRLAASWNRS